MKLVKLSGLHPKFYWKSSWLGEPLGRMVVASCQVGSQHQPTKAGWQISDFSAMQGYCSSTESPWSMAGPMPVPETLTDSVGS